MKIQLHCVQHTLCFQSSAAVLSNFDLYAPPGPTVLKSLPWMEPAPIFFNSAPQRKAQTGSKQYRQISMT